MVQRLLVANIDDVGAVSPELGWWSTLAKGGDKEAWTTKGTQRGQCGPQSVHPQHPQHPQSTGSQNSFLFLPLLQLKIEFVLLVANIDLFSPSSSELLQGYFIDLPSYLALHLLDFLLSIDSFGLRKV